MSSIKNRPRIRRLKRAAITRRAPAKKAPAKKTVPKRPLPKKPETRSDSDKPVRTPDVIVDFEFENGSLSIIIENIGDDAAHDVEIKFNKRISGLQRTKDISSMNIFKNLKFLPPGKKIKIFVDSFLFYVAYKQQMQIRAAVMFVNKTKQRFENSIQHDLTIYKDIAESYKPVTI